MIKKYFSMYMKNRTIDKSETDRQCSVRIITQKYYGGMMNRFTKAFSALAVMAIAAGAVTPNSSIVNDFPLEFDQGWSNFQSGFVEKWRVDSTAQSSGGAMSLVESQKNVYTFSGNKPAAVSVYTITNGVASASGKRNYSFHTDNLGYSLVGYNKNSSNVWEKSDSINLRYNSSNGVISWDMVTYADGATNSMVVYRNANNLVDSTIWSMSMVSGGYHMNQVTKSVYIYDSDNRYMSISDTTTETVVEMPAYTVPPVIEFTKFTYGTQLMTVVKQKCSSATWTNADSIIVTLDADNRIMSEESYAYTNDTWSADCKLVYTYIDTTSITETEYNADDASAWILAGSVTKYYTDYNGPALPGIDITGVKSFAAKRNTASVTAPELLINRLIASKAAPGALYMLNGKAAGLMIQLKNKGTAQPLVRK